MVVWSTFVRSCSISQNLQKIYIFRNKLLLNNVITPSQTCCMSSEMIITASRWQWHKTKDMIHFYFLIMALPLSIVTFGANVFVGPATLTEIPEDYYPQYWEYYRNPITRFMAHYLFFNPQKDYEKSIHMIYLESQIMEIRKLEQKVWDLQDERKDFRYNLYIPFNYVMKSSYMQGLQDDNDFGD